MRIGEIAEKANVSKSIIRYYEGKGLLPRPARNAAGYRDYDDADLARIQLVTGARRLGCSFEQIRAVVTLEDTPNIPALHMEALLADKVVEVRKEIDRLQRVQLELARLYDLAQSQT